MIAEFIYQAQQDYNQIKALFPDIANVNFEIEDVPLEEMKGYADEHSKRLEKAVWRFDNRLHFYASHTPLISIFSKKLVKQEPTYIEAEVQLA